MQRHRRYSLLKRKGAQIESITVRETNGRDEETAAEYAKAKGGSATIQEELARLSVVAFNDRPVKHELATETFDGWNSKTRGYVLIAWRDLNVVEDAEDFRKSGEDVKEEPAPAAKSADGSGASG